jgi:hypothetical protein
MMLFFASSTFALMMPMEKFVGGEQVRSVGNRALYFTTTHAFFVRLTAYYTTMGGMLILKKRPPLVHRYINLNFC